MAKGFKHGGSSPLNFKVVGNPKPANPKENTIWIDTNEKITGWEFSATEPVGRNLLTNTASSRTTNGVTFTVNADGSITVNGTATSTAYFGVGNLELLAGTEYIMSGCPESGSGSSYFLQCKMANNVYVHAAPSEKKFVPSVAGTSWVEIVVAQGSTANNVVFYPIVCLASEADSHIDGKVWIMTYTYSPGSFNAMKRNGITVYPVGAMQYLSGSWANKPVQLYQHGVWLDLFVYLYNAGSENIDLTGGWIAKAGDWASGSDDTQRAPVIERKTDSMRVYQNGTGGGYATPTIKIDLTGYTKLKADVTVNATGSPDWTRFSILKPGALMSDEMATVMMNLGRNVYSLDISSISGTQIVAFVLYKLSSTQADITVHKVWLER